jgi:hypothetical protein
MFNKKFYIIVFNNGKKKRILFKSNIYRTTKEKYKILTKKKTSIFPINVLAKEKADLELGLLTTDERKTRQIYRKDILGRNIKLEMGEGDMFFIDLKKYNQEEKIYDHKKQKRIEALELIDTYIPQKKITQVFTLNNKLIVQVDDLFKLFSLKNVVESKRLIDCIESYLLDRGYGNCLFIKDFSTIQRKQLYRILEENGFNRKMLYKHYTY